MKVLITGANGFVASHLIDRILNENSNAEIYGSIRRLADKGNIQHVLDDINLIDMELIDSYSVSKAVRTVEPDRVFHLAAQSYVPNSWTSPSSTLQTNVIGTMNLLEAIRNYNKDTFVLVAGSSEEYGLVKKEECPINENQALRPLSPYGVSKVAVDKLGYQYAMSYDMNIVVTRAFNMTGPRRGEAFVDSNFAKQIIEMESNKRKYNLTHGNLDAVRDFTDVRDTVRAMYSLSDLKWDGDAVNICSGKGRTIKELMSTLVNMSYIGRQITTIPDPERMRPSDVPVLIGDCTKLKSLIDWTPEYSWKDSLKDLLNYWSNKIGCDTYGK